MRVNFKYKILIISLSVLVLLLGTALCNFLINKPEKEIREPCLADNEFADYYPYLPVVSQPVIISVKDKNTNQERFNFQIEGVRETYLVVQLRNCGVYVIRQFNYDPKKTKQDLGYKEEIWKYTYDGNGTSIILLDEKQEEFISYYSPEFQIDPAEHYVTLIKGYFGSPDYAIVIKNLKTLKDLFALTITEIEKHNAEIVGNISFEDWWSDNGRYFWGRTHLGANTLSFFRIDTNSWKADFFPAPQGVLGGDALNVERGCITVHSGNIWFGIAEVNEEEKARRRAQGIGTELYIHNLITGDRRFIDKTTEPLWFFKPKWLSDTELEYELPSGERKVYKIDER